MQAISDNFVHYFYNPAMNGGRPTDKEASPLGARIAQARRDAGLSQNELAQKTDLKRHLIAHWERRAVSLKAEQLVTLADALNVSTDYLLSREHKKTGGPTGLAQKLFQEVSKLPRHHQQRILSTVEDMLLARKKDP